MSTLFIQITPEITNYTIASNLSKMQYRVWLYLYHLDPFGDRTVSIPQPQELATTLNMSARSIYRAFNKLSQLGLFTISSSYQRIITNGVKNQPLGTKQARCRKAKKIESLNKTPLIGNKQDITDEGSLFFKASEKRDFSVNAKNVTTVPEMSSTLPKTSQECQNWQNRSSKGNDINNFQASQTNSDFKKTYSDKNEVRTQRSEVRSLNIKFNDSNSKSIALTSNNSPLTSDLERSDLTSDFEKVDFWFEDNIDSSTAVKNKFIDDRSLSRDVEQTGEKSNPKVVNSNNQAASIDQLEIEQKNHFTPIDRPDEDDDDDFKQTDLSDRDRTITAEIVEDRSITNNADRQLESKKPLTSDLRPLTSFNWLPPGPWQVDGKLDPHFRDWLAQDWLSRYGGTIHQKRADVLSHFKKDPANLPIRWEQYQSEYLDRFKNAKTRLDNGIAIAPDEQQQLKDHAAAIYKSISQTHSIVANKKVFSEGQPVKNCNYACSRTL